MSEQKLTDEQIHQAARDIIGMEAVCIEWGAEPKRSVELCEDRIRELLGMTRRYPK